jgi:O-antigen/teichoic acid export membrane protein
MSVRKHTLINLVGSILPIAVMLVTVPLYLKLLGDVRFGVMTLVWLLLGYFSFLEMGLGRATANQIAKAHDAPDTVRSEIFWTALLINALFGTIGALVLWLAGDYLLSSVLKMPAEFKQEAIAALPWMIATLPLALVSSVLNGALEGRNRFLTVNVLQVTSNTVFQVVPLIAAYWYSPSLAVVIPVAVLSRTLMNVPFLIACYTCVPLKLLPHFSIERAKVLTNYGGWVAITGVISPIMETLDRFLIGAVLGAQAVTYYTLPNQLVTRLRIIPGSLSRALFPKFSADAVSADKLASDSLHYLTAAVAPIVLIALFMIEPFMVLWIGPSLANIAAPLGQIMLLGIWLNSLAYIPLGLLQAKGRPDLVAKLHMMELMPFLIVLYFAISQWGVIGAAIAWTLRVVADAVLLFYAAGIKSTAFKIIKTPTLIITLSVLTLNLINKLGFVWHLISALIFILWAIVWLKNTHALAMVARIIAQRRNPLNATSIKEL